MHHRSIFATFLALIFSTLCIAQPTLSRGQQILSITYDECLSRAQTAYSAEGWVNIGTSGNAVNAFKGVNGAYIICNPAPDAKMAVNIIVTSSSTDSGVPGSERQRLQGRMDMSISLPTVGKADWGTTATSLRGQNVRASFDCPSGGDARNIWGTDYYTDDSSICTAAVHAGLITFAAGGRVTIEIRQGLQSYQGSARNGASSLSYGAWSGSFVFVR